MPLPHRLIASGVLGGDVSYGPAYSGTLITTYGASEVYPLTDIASGTSIPAKVNASYNGTLGGWDLQNSVGPVPGTFAPYNDGSASDYGNLAPLAAIWNGTIGAIGLCVKVSAAADWTDSTIRYLFRVRSDASNYIMVQKHSDNNKLRILASFGGGSGNFYITSMTSTDWLMVVLTYKDGNNGNEIKAYINGVANAGSITGLNVWSGSPGTVAIGTDYAGSSSGWKGPIAYSFWKFGSVWTPTQIANMYAALSESGPENP